MKHTGICPKCGGGTVVEAASGSNFVSTGVFRTVRTHYWICCSCGFVEEWIPEEALDQVRKCWRSTEEDDQA